MKTAGTILLSIRHQTYYTRRHRNYRCMLWKTFPFLAGIPLLSSSNSTHIYEHSKDIRSGRAEGGVAGLREQWNTRHDDMCTGKVVCWMQWTAPEAAVVSAAGVPTLLWWSFLPGNAGKTICKWSARKAGNTTIIIHWYIHHYRGAIHIWHIICVKDSRITK